MNEGDLKDRLVATGRLLLPAFVWTRHEDHGTIGVPDLTTTGLGVTVWEEIKYADPTFTSDSLQELVMRRLAKQGRARYIIFREDNFGKQIGVLTPEEFKDWKRLGTWHFCKGAFEMEWVVRQIWSLHQP